MTNSIADTKKFFEKMVSDPNDKNFHVQLGCHLEEVVEMLDCLKWNDDRSFTAWEHATYHLDNMAESLKKGELSFRLEVGDREEFLDAVCDQIVTATGLSHMQGMDIIGGMEEVNRSNNSKFDEDGNPIFDENGKMTKGPNFFKPDFSPYV